MLDIYKVGEKAAKDYLIKQGLASMLEKGNTDEIPPKWDDIARLYHLVRTRKPFQILEFGSGFSTIVMAKALEQNYKDYLEYINKNYGKIIYDQPNIVSVESSSKWMRNTQNKVESIGLNNYSTIVLSEAVISNYQGQLCHFYEKLPDVVPDFVYLDGPDPATVKGNVSGLSFQNPKRTVMAADLLLYESTLTPGFFMIVDGRSNNARFLQSMLKRKYHTIYYEHADVTTFELDEPRLGMKNIFGCEAFKTG